MSTADRQLGRKANGMRMGIRGWRDAVSTGGIRKGSRVRILQNNEER